MPADAIKDERYILTLGSEFMSGGRKLSVLSDEFPAIVANFVRAMAREGYPVTLEGPGSFIPSKNTPFNVVAAAAEEATYGTDDILMWGVHTTRDTLRAMVAGTVAPRAR